MQCKDCKFFYNNFPLVIMNTRAVANVFAKGFYMGNYVEVEYSYPANVSDGSKISSITAKVTVYSEYDKATKSLKNVLQYTEGHYRTMQKGEALRLPLKH